MEAVDTESQRAHHAGHVQREADTPLPAPALLAQLTLLGKPGSPKFSYQVPLAVERKGYLRLRPVLDFLLACVLFVFAAPAIILLGLIVKLTSRGPALYTQTRVGVDGQLFTIYKLRTMYHNVEAFTGPTWAVPRDPRATMFGKFLRATHLDELPQLLNVLRGDMALIGPRPERPEIVNFLQTKVEHYTHRLRVKPGISGLAQVRLPADSVIDLEGVRRKLTCDRFYLENISLWLDVRLMLCTGLLLFGIPFRVTRFSLRIPNPLKTSKVNAAPVKPVTFQEISRSA